MVVALGTAAFGMQDILLEPYGAQVLGLSVSATTVLTAILAGGTLLAFFVAARWLTHGTDPHRLAAFGSLIGIVAFVLVIFAAPLESAGVFRVGTALIGFGGGLFAVGTLTAAMDLAKLGGTGLALGAWGAVQATAAGVAIAAGAALRDAVARLAVTGDLGPAVAQASAGYTVVYQLEIVLLFATLAAVGPLVRTRRDVGAESGREFGLSEMPG